MGEAAAGGATQPPAVGTLPLAGVKVIDLTIAMAGPLASQRLADMGADVVKVESIGGGDLTRPFELAGVRLKGESTSFLSLNRGKRSIVIDLKSPGGLRALLDLAAGADVVFQNFRPGVAERLGVGYDDIRAVNPKIVYASITGYGEAGPMVGAPGQDLLVQAFSGMMFNAGRDSDPPHPAPVYLIDAAASMLATAGIAAALFQRERTGHGQHVRTSLLGAALEIQCQELMTYMVTGEPAERSAAPYASAWLDPPYGIYPTADGWLALSQNDLAVVADVIEAPDLRAHSKRKPPSGDQRMRAWREQVYALLAAGLGKRTTAEWVDALTAHKLWCGPVQTYAELVAHPQAADHLMDVEHPEIGAIRSVAPAVRFEATAGQCHKAAPSYGADTDIILSEIGYSSDRIEALRQAGAVL